MSGQHFIGSIELAVGIALCFFVLSLLTDLGTKAAVEVFAATAAAGIGGTLCLAGFRMVTS